MKCSGLLFFLILALGTFAIGYYTKKWKLVPLILLYALSAWSLGYLEGYLETKFHLQGPWVDRLEWILTFFVGSWVGSQLLFKTQK